MLKTYVVVNVNMRSGEILYCLTSSRPIEDIQLPKYISDYKEIPVLGKKDDSYKIFKFILIGFAISKASSILRHIKLEGEKLVWDTGKEVVCIEDFPVEQTESTVISPQDLHEQQQVELRNKMQEAKQELLKQIKEIPKENRINRSRRANPWVQK